MGGLKPLPLVMTAGLALTLPAWPQAPAAGYSGASPEAKLTLVRLTRYQTPPSLDSLEYLIPRVLQASLLPYDWLQVEVRETWPVQAPPSSPVSKTPSAPPANEFVLEGHYFPVGDRVRLDVRLKRADGTLVLGESLLFTTASLLDAIKALGEKCIREIRPGVTPVKSEAGIQVAIARRFATSGEGGWAAHLATALPNAILRELGRLKAVSASFASSPGLSLRAQEGRPSAAQFVVSGYCRVERGAVVAGAQVRERDGIDLTITLRVAEEAAPLLPGTLAARVAEVLQARITAEGRLRPLPVTPSGAAAQAYLKEAERASEARQHEVAILMLRLAQQHSPDPSDARLRLAELYIERQDAAAATGEINQILESGGKSVAAYYAQGLKESLSGDHLEAVREFERAVKASRSGDALRGRICQALGDAYSALYRDAEAASAYEKALREGRSQPAVHLALARAYRAMNRFGDALKALEQGRAAFPASSDLREALASAYRDQGVMLYDARKYEQAVDVLEKAVALEPANRRTLSEALAYAGAAWGMHVPKKDPKKGEEYLRKAVELEPARTGPHIQLAALYRQQKRFKEAIRSFERVAELSPSLSSYRELSEVFQEDGDYAGAIGALQRATTLRGTDAAEANIDLAVLYDEAGDYSSALRCARTAQDLDPHSERALRAEGYVYESLGKLDDAIRRYRKALETDPTDVGYWALGDCLYQKKEYTEAEKQFRKSLEINPKSASALALLAKVRAARNRLSEAFALARKAVDVQPKGNPDPYYVLAELYYQQGQPEAAVPDLQSRLSKDPDNFGVLAALSYHYHERLFNFGAAYDANRRILRLDPHHQVIKENWATMALTTGRFDEAIDIVNELLAGRGYHRPHTRLGKRLVSVAARLSKGQTALALSEAGKFIADYWSFDHDWKRTSSYAGLRRWVSQSPLRGTPSEDLLLGLMRILETPKPECDGLVNALENSPDSPLLKIK